MAFITTTLNNNEMEQLKKDLDALTPEQTTYELCPHCGYETRMRKEFVAQHCEDCGKLNIPCNMCEDMDCKNCPFEK